MNLARYFSTMNTELICKVYHGFQEYEKHNSFIEGSGTDYVKAVLDYIETYSKEPHTLEEIKAALYKEMAARLFKYKNTIAKGNAYDQVRWERDIAIEQLNEIGCELGETMDHIKELIDNHKKSLDH